MSRIAIVSQFYAPEPCAAANRVAAMARAFAEAGHDVRVYTGMPSFPDGVIAEPYRGVRHVVEHDGAVAVERVWTYASATSLPGNRLMNWLSVALGIAMRLVAARARFDTIVVSSPPITLALPALLGAFAHRAPLVVDVRDVWPEIAVTMGSWQPRSRIARLVGWAADRLYARAVLVTCVTDTARDQILARGVAPAKVVVAPNGFDPVVPAAVAPAQPPPGVRDVVYVGNMGLATGLDVVLGAAARLRDDPTIRFVLIGGGADAGRLRKRAAVEGLSNVVFTGTLPRPDSLRALADAAATVVPLVATIVDSLPTKLFDAMLVGTPIVVSAAGEARRLVERADAGIAVTPGDPDALAAGLRRVLGDASLRARFRANGPAFVRANYDRAVVMSRLAERVRALSSR
ncbi:MAG TPA: glycosyltransferase family 4 protein [Candidatus Elarobacter sp.]|nr:glycosyltransferase family 4 protein [Candidatus Elarobacter sp.]